MACSSSNDVAPGCAFSTWARAAAADSSLPRIESSHRPSRTKMWEGMCSACGDDSAIFE
jgi:hypothetical protein